MRSVASCEQSFSKLKLIKSCLRSTMGQSRLTGVSVLSVENTVASGIEFRYVINQFATLKSRQANF